MMFSSSLELKKFDISKKTELVFLSFTDANELLGSVGLIRPMGENVYEQIEEARIVSVVGVFGVDPVWVYVQKTWKVFAATKERRYFFEPTEP